MSERPLQHFTDGPPMCVEDGVTWRLAPFQHLTPGDLFRFGPSFAGPVWTYSGSGFYRTTLGPDSNATLQQIEGRVWIAVAHLRNTEASFPSARAAMPHGGPRSLPLNPAPSVRRIGRNVVGNVDTRTLGDRER